MLPFSSLGETFEDVARGLGVYLIILIFFIAQIIALPSPFDVFMRVPFLLITVYFWAVYRPSFLPALVVFILGITADMITGAPIGVGAIILVTLHWAISNQRAFIAAQSFPMVWLIFAIIYAGVTIIEWLIFGLVNLGWTPMKTIVSQFISGIVAFPFLMIIYHLAHKVLPKQKFPLTSL